MAIRIAVYTPDSLPESFRVVVDNITRELLKLGCDVIAFSRIDESLASADVVWDPRAGGGVPPVEELCRLHLPQVITCHGVAPMALPAFEYFGSIRGAIRGSLRNRTKKKAWRDLESGYAAVVSVSCFSASNICDVLPINPAKVSWCYNAIDHALFSAPESGEYASGAKYFFHISNGEPRKNIQRILKAHDSLPRAIRLPLLLKVPTGVVTAAAEDVEVISGRLEDAELVSRYRNAACFVFPSLYEGFGLPILEAMACGCPVITSDTTACSEVAGDAAMKVNPRSVQRIAAAMCAMQDPAQRNAFSELGLRRAAEFRWEVAARHYLKVFQKALSGAT